MFLQRGYAQVDPKTQFLSSDAGQPVGLMSHKKKIPDIQVGCIEQGYVGVLGCSPTHLQSPAGLFTLLRLGIPIQTFI